MRIVALILLMLTIFFGLIASTGRMIFLWLKLIFKNLNSLVFFFIYTLFVCLILTVFIVGRMPEAAIPRVVIQMGHYALGVFLYLLMTVNLLALLIFLGKLLRFIPSPVSPSVILPAGILGLLLVTGLSVYGIINATKVHTSQYTVLLGENHKEQAEMDSLQIALVSDLHLGYIVEEEHLAKVVARVNAAEPDLVCLAGDVFDGNVFTLSNPARLKELLRSIKAKYGVYACLGNHDAGSEYEQMVAFLTAAGVQVLQDEAVVIDHRVLLVGRKDSSPIGAQGVVRQVAVTLPEAQSLPVIVMDHQPSNIGEYGPETDLVLSGHSHQGQMFPFNLITNAYFIEDYGHYKASASGPQHIVTSGAGTWGPPLRVATKNEIAEIRVLFPKKSLDGEI